MREMSLFDIAIDWVDSKWMPPSLPGSFGCYGWQFANYQVGLDTLHRVLYPSLNPAIPPVKDINTIRNFTQGPWNIFPHTNGRLGCTIGFEGRDTGFTSTDICVVMPEDDNGAAIRVADANARLIAAAPDLLRALLKVQTDMLRTDFEWDALRT